jgi:hypothetical protein
MTTTINITWHQPDERSQGREDSAWYTYQSQHDAVCTVSNGEREITVYADGEMRVTVYDNINGDDSMDSSTLRYCDQWREYGINNDAEIFEASENGLIDWVNNSWFDLYTNDHNVGEDGWLDSVNHSLSDAIEQATLLLSEDELWNGGK